MAIKLTIFVFFLLLLHKIHSESVSFGFDFKDGVPPSMILLGDAIPATVILLNRVDEKPGTNHYVGRAVYSAPIRLWDSDSGEVADFTTEFSFSVSTGSSDLRGDGLTFFMAPVADAVRVPENSTGGLFGLFSPETAFSPPQNGILAVELDTFSNEWDPPFPHVGIDVNSLMSVNITGWPIHDTALGSVWNVRISYESKTKTMSVSMGYPGANPPTLVSLSRVIELKDVLPEYVRIGFSAATGALIETHNLFAWSFRSFLAEESSP